MIHLICSCKWKDGSIEARQAVPTEEQTRFPKIEPACSKTSSRAVAESRRDRFSRTKPCPSHDRTESSMERQTTSKLLHLIIRAIILLSVTEKFLAILLLFFDLGPTGLVNASPSSSLVAGSVESPKLLVNGVLDNRPGRCRQVSSLGFMQRAI